MLGGSGPPAPPAARGRCPSMLHTGWAHTAAAGGLPPLKVRREVPHGSEQGDGGRCRWKGRYGRGASGAVQRFCPRVACTQQWTAARATLPVKRCFAPGSKQTRTHFPHGPQPMVWPDIVPAHLRGPLPSPRQPPTTAGPPLQGGSRRRVSEEGGCTKGGQDSSVDSFVRPCLGESVQLQLQLPPAGPRRCTRALLPLL